MTAYLSSTSIAFYDILVRACVEIKILRQESDLHLSRLAFCIFLIFFLLFLFPLSFLSAAVIGLLMGLLASKRLQRSVIKMSKFYHGEATCNGRKFRSEFFTQLFVRISGAIKVSTYNGTIPCD